MALSKTARLGGATESTGFLVGSQEQRSMRLNERRWVVAEATRFNMSQKSVFGSFSGFDLAARKKSARIPRVRRSTSLVPEVETDNKVKEH